MKSLADAPLRGRNVLLVADYNVQIEGGVPVCAFKIDQTLPTIRHILGAACRSLTIASHMGRPRGRDEFSMRPVYEYLRGKLAGLQYRRCQEVERGLAEGEQAPRLLMTDNLRYYGEDELKAFYGSFETIVSDAFGCAHRETLFRGFAGLLMAREIERLDAARRSDLVIMGGAKIRDKLQIMERLGGTVFAGGCLGITLLRTLGIEVGRHSRCEAHDGAGVRSRLVVGSKQGTKKASGAAAPGSEDGGGRCPVILPVDFYVIEHLEGRRACKIKGYDEISEEDECVDIGPLSVELLRQLVGRSRSVLWNGPVGKTAGGRAGSTGLLVKMLQASQAEVVAGGGETLAAIVEHSSTEEFAHVSTGGGAMLQLLGGGAMPGIESLL